MGMMKSRQVRVDFAKRLIRKVNYTRKCGGTVDVRRTACLGLYVGAECPVSNDLCSILALEKNMGRRCDGTFLDLVDTRGAVDRPRACDRDLLPVGPRHRVRVWRSRRVARCVIADAAHRRWRAVGDSARCRALLAQAYRRSARDGATRSRPLGTCRQLDSRAPRAR